jgi:hypothetical protein
MKSERERGMKKVNKNWRQIVFVFTIYLFFIRSQRHVEMEKINSFSFSSRLFHFSLHLDESESESYIKLIWKVVESLNEIHSRKWIKVLSDVVFYPLSEITSTLFIIQRDVENINTSQKMHSFNSYFIVYKFLWNLVTIFNGTNFSIRHEPYDDFPIKILSYLFTLVSCEWVSVKSQCRVGLKYFSHEIFKIL